MSVRVMTYLFLLVLFSGCRKENAFDCFTASGPEVSQFRYPGSFSSLRVHDKFDVTIVQGPEYKVEVTAGANLLKNISTRVEDDKLIINNLNTCNFVRGYKHVLRVTVTTPYIRRIQNSGVGTLRIDQNFVQDSIAIRSENSGDIYMNGSYDRLVTSSHGNGDIYLGGRCKTLYVYTYGTNYVRAEELEISDYAFIDTYTIGDVYVNAGKLKLFEYHIARDGNIYYSGDPPEVNDYSSGMGKGKAIRY